MRFTIDRFEGDYAIVELEGKEMLDMPRILLPLDAKEGDIINVSIDKEGTENRKKEIQDRFNNLFSE